MRSNRIVGWCAIASCALVAPARAQTALRGALAPQVETAAEGSEEREQTLLSGQVTHGGYGGPRLAYGRIAGRDAVTVGGEGGWIINHSIILGVAGCGLVSSQPAPGAYASNEDLTLGYGGLMLGYTFFSDRLVHGTLSALVGAGGMGTRSRFGPDTRDLNDAFFVFEPTATVELNVARHFRLGAALSYRLVRGVETDGITNSDLSGLFGSMVLKFGKF